MSGGRFEYKQYAINDIAEDIERELNRQGKEKSPDNRWSDDDIFYHTYSIEVQEAFKEGAMLLRKSAIYAQRIDWLLSDDDGEDTFLERLKKDLSKL